MKRQVVSLMIVSVVFLSVVLDVQAARPARRQARQAARIHQGVKSGELTRGEAHRLRKEERGIRKEKRQMMRDGKLDPAERRKLRQDQNQASKDIYNAKHNDVKRGEGTTAAPAAPAPATPAETPPAQ